MKTWLLAAALALSATTAAAQGATITAPTAGATLPGASVAFTWSAGTGIVRYWLEIGTTKLGHELWSHPQSVTTRSAAVTGLPTDGRAVYATLYSITAGDIWTFVETTYKAAGTPPPPVLVTGSSRIGWTQPGQTVAQVLTGITRLYVDAAGAGAVLVVACTVVSGATDCTAPIPALTPGDHTLALDYTPKGGAAVGRSNTIRVTTTITLTPIALGLRR